MKVSYMLGIHEPHIRGRVTRMPLLWFVLGVAQIKQPWITGMYTDKFGMELTEKR